jgi:hypothetical protein
MIPFLLNGLLVVGTGCGDDVHEAIVARKT